jgi:signal transduction histidine kinase
MFEVVLRRYRRRIVPLSLVLGLIVAGAGVAAALVLAPSGQQLLSSRLIAVAAASAAVAFLVGVTSYVVGMNIVRTLVGQIQRAVDGEIRATQELTALNKMLSLKVAEAKEEVHNLSDKMLLMQEEERRRIARELHDGVGQALAALQIELDFARKNPDEARPRVEEASRILSEAMVGLRQAVHDLRPPEIGSLPLPEIFATYCERFELRSGIRTSFRWRGAAISSEPIATCLLRILQEAFTNISRHARATEVGVSVRVGETAAELQVQDDGVGFDPQSPRAGTGLRGIRERCAFFGGDCSVESSPGAGARLQARIPLAKNISTMSLGS